MIIYSDLGNRNLWWNSEIDVTDWSTPTGEELGKEKFDMSEMWGFGFIRQAQELYAAARCLELRFMQDPKDKLLDEMCIRHLRRLANALFEQGVNQLQRNRSQSEVTVEENDQAFTEVIKKANES